MTALNVLVATEKQNNKLLERILRQCEHEVTSLEMQTLDLPEIVKATTPDILILDIIAPSDTVLQMLARVNQNHSLPVIMFAEDPGTEIVDQIIKAGVSAYVVASYETKRIKLIIETAIARFKERQALQQELEKTKTKLEERKVVEKAKGILSNSQGISEDKAYHILRKLAMERSISMAEMAQNVISMASLLQTEN